jgi:biotin carboxyl carrier protein
MSSAAIGSGSPSSVATPPGAGQAPAQESALWAVLAGASGPEQFCQSWLAIQCRLIPGVAGGVVLLQAADGRYAPSAVWPDVRRDMSHLTQAAQRALVERRGLVMPGAEGAGHQVAYPVEAVGTLHGVVVLEVAPRAESELQAVLRQLHWGAAGLELLFYRGAVAREVQSRARLQTVLELVASAAGQERYTASAMALVTELATRLECDRVSLGFVQAGQIRIDAFSHSAQFKERTNLVRSVAAAMDEAVDQGATVAWPPIPGALPVVARAHEALAKEQGGTVCTIPMQVGNAFVGAITLERTAAKPFDDASLELLEALVGLAAPILDTHRREDQWFGKRVLIWWKEKLRQLFGPRHAGLKFGVLLAALLLAFMTLAKGPFRVSAGTALEPLVQQAAAAPFNGYVREAPVRAGDLVKAGTVLARLDDRELKLERLKWIGQEEELGKQLRQAMADRNAAQVQIVSAQLDQARAQVARVEDQLARTTIAAPFDGVVVSGDLSQQLGAPVERGTVLFEVAPLESFRLVVKVDERDVAYVEAGQRGSLLLSAFPDDAIGFTVRKVTPVSTARDGRNFFRVEAELDRTDPRMRPNMEGVGKVDVGERRYVWIWTRSVVDGLRLLLWQWLP